jgi:hypothetical protein
MLHILYAYRTTWRKVCCKTNRWSGQYENITFAEGAHSLSQIHVFQERGKHWTLQLTASAEFVFDALHIASSRRVRKLANGIEMAV